MRVREMAAAAGGRKVAAECPKKVASLIDLVNLPSTLREFAGQSRMSHLAFFLRMWSHIKTHKLQDLQNKSTVNCDDKLKTIFLARSQIDLAELPALVKLHFPRQPK